MQILHTESSNGWGGQEIRILKEAQGMRERGHTVVFAVVKHGKLVEKARKEGFTVYEIPFERKRALLALFKLLFIIKKHRIDIVNTHTSLDAWLGGIAARMMRKKVVRTRHLSTQIRAGINSRLLYGFLADKVVTTSSGIIPMICAQAKKKEENCICIPTGVDPTLLKVSEPEVSQVRKTLGLKEGDFLVGTACFVRSWKGIRDLMQAALILKEIKNLKWVIVGGGYVDQYRPMATELGLQETVLFTGHLENPFPAIAAMDIFLLLSTAHEGISQATLQAAYLKRALITTTIGGLPEVCLDEITGFTVPPLSPENVAKKVKELLADASLRRKMGYAAHMLVKEKFTLKHTLDSMERIYHGLFLPHASGDSARSSGKLSDLRDVASEPSGSKKS